MPILFYLNKPDLSSNWNVSFTRDNSKILHYNNFVDSLAIIVVIIIILFIYGLKT